MCGIFGSFNFRRFEKLYNENKTRGHFAYGSMYVRPATGAGLAKDVWTRKVEGTVDLTGHYAFQQDYEQFLGHTQAPTSVNRDFSPASTHPFDSVHYRVAHNGVLENHVHLCEEYLPGWWQEEYVDSQSIPGLLSMNVEFDERVMMSHELEEGKTEDVIAIENVCSELKGTFACWIYSKLSGDTYVVRSGSTLYGNVETGDFSSVKVDGLCEQELKQGVVYCVTCEGLAECGSFVPNSPFFL